MLDSFVYESHLGKRFIGLENGVYLNYSDLRDYSWSYDKINDRIARFYRPITTRKIPLWAVGLTEDAAIYAMNRLHDLVESDIEAKLPGKIYVGEYYTTGYITSSKKSQYLKAKRMCKFDLVLTSDDPAWYHEITHVFGSGSDDAGTSDYGADYPYDYEYDYTPVLNGRRIVCDTVSSNAFKLQIYGPATDPSVTIGEHVYAINGSIAAGDVLLIDSLTKTITHSTQAGRRTNWFARRNRDSYIFEPIPAGMNLVSWVGSFGFDLTVIEKRSEPKWI